MRKGVPCSKNSEFLVRRGPLCVQTTLPYEPAPWIDRRSEKGITSVPSDLVHPISEVGIVLL